ncbi:Alanine--tRNA ligase, mitochondrial [Gossypium arboreum]|uniref:Alanine--tRNA ligase, mitochondrial n=1 Tax=Gossypium arboreum TaxID=29729 RepID=A0A0B0MCJ3_GOSAR|nr:Alanine--tRNA ligase, mitochondrial [Gossypium arboreum]
MCRRHLTSLENLKVMLSESGATCRGRRRTMLKDLYDLDPVEHVKVSRNSHGQPVGSEARLLAAYLGILA